MENALRGLRDIDGVLGSFLLDHDGELLARDMPGIFDDATLRSASLRLWQMRGAFETEGHAFEGCTARFGDHLLVLRSAQKRTLCVLCPVGTNLTTLQMGLNLLARRAHEVPARPAFVPPPAPPPRPSAPPPQPALAAPPVYVEPPQEPQSTTRFFRGRPVP